ncbi:DUF2585 family protein [Neotabrizicola shimadae]|uniref:DUF2585 family protein n=1 Tax=Neotabrizicola shimadae TaxID=2807096 RepID=A0A8G0ZVS9_9RHOB|nr:DUF2585 family protein [Neotabrizicola shimadae]QYZ68919.1 DUF2585 family protein [Neotabrizicola shimadae]
MTDRRLPYALVAALILSQGVILWSWGHPLICTCGYVKLWHGVTYSSENSQHLTDWYTPSHIIHGILFYAGLWLVARRVDWRWRLVMAVVIEAAWELLENTDWVINRYREVTISLDYYGDSVINSVFDTLAMILGFLLARVAPVWVSVAVVVGFEVLTTALIRDGLALNVLMLLWPLQAVLDWQAAG